MFCTNTAESQLLVRVSYIRPSRRIHTTFPFLRSYMTVSPFGRQGVCRCLSMLSINAGLSWNGTFPPCAKSGMQHMSLISALVLKCCSRSSAQLTSV